MKVRFEEQARENLKRAVDGLDRRRVLGIREKTGNTSQAGSDLDQGHPCAGVRRIPVT